MRVSGRIRRGVALVSLIAGMALGVGAAAWASEGTAPDALPTEDGTAAPVSAAEAGPADALGAVFLVEGPWFVLEVRPGLMLLTLKSDTEGGADVVFEIPALRTRNHGGYVSALATALEPGPRRGQIVSALARSAVGRPDKLEKLDKTHGSDRPDKGDKPDKADKPADDDAELGEESGGGVKDKAPGHNKASDKNTASGMDRSPDKARGNSRGH